MTRRTDTHPDVARPEIGAPFFSTWRVGTPLRQRQVIDAIGDVWEQRPWPSDGLLGYYVYAGQDGSTLLHYSQWSSERAYEDFVTAHRQERVDEIDTAVPGIERLQLGRYRHYRSVRRPDDTRVPGCIVIVDIEFEGSVGSAGSEGFERSGGSEGSEGSAADRRRAWVDAVIEALAAEPNPHPGGVSAHFHLGTDGSSTTPSGRAPRPMRMPSPPRATASARRWSSGSACRPGRG